MRHLSSFGTRRTHKYDGKAKEEYARKCSGTEEIERAVSGGINTKASEFGWFECVIFDLGMCYVYWNSHLFTRIVSTGNFQLCERFSTLRSVKATFQCVFSI